MSGSIFLLCSVFSAGCTWTETSKTNLFFPFQSIPGLVSFRYQKVGKKSELVLLWAAEDPEEPPVEQVGTPRLFFEYTSLI